MTEKLLRCNSASCGNEVRAVAWITYCSHIFCDADGKKYISKLPCNCPSCGVTLQSKDDVYRIDLDPSEQLKSIEKEHQRHQKESKVLNKKLSELQIYYEDRIKITTHEVNEVVKQLQEQKQEKENAQGQNETLRLKLAEKDRQYHKLKILYESLRSRRLSPATNPGELRSPINFRAQKKPEITEQNWTLGTQKELGIMEQNLNKNWNLGAQKELGIMEQNLNIKIDSNSQNMCSFPRPNSQNIAPVQTSEPFQEPNSQSFCIVQGPGFQNFCHNQVPNSENLIRPLLPQTWKLSNEEKNQSSWNSNLSRLQYLGPNPGVALQGPPEGQDRTKGESIGPFCQKNSITTPSKFHFKPNIRSKSGM